MFDNYNWKDFGERVGRAFATAAISAALALTLHPNVDGNIITVLIDNWQAVAGAGVVASLTAIKALVGQGRGDDPTDGRLK